MSSKIDPADIELWWNDCFVSVDNALKRPKLNYLLEDIKSTVDIQLLFCKSPSEAALREAEVTLQRLLTQIDNNMTFSNPFSKSFNQFPILRKLMEDYPQVGYAWAHQ